MPASHAREETRVASFNQRYTKIARVLAATARCQWRSSRPRRSVSRRVTMVRVSGVPPLSPPSLVRTPHCAFLNTGSGGLVSTAYLPYAEKLIPTTRHTERENMLEIGPQGPSYDYLWLAIAAFAMALTVASFIRLIRRSDSFFITILSALLILVPWIGAATHLLLTRRQTKAANITSN